jgi:hypothetical protein
LTVLAFASDFIELAAQTYTGPSMNISLKTTDSPAPNAIPLVEGAFAVIYNVITAVNLDTTIVSNINLGLIRHWNDTSIQALNPDTQLSHQEIIPNLNQSNSSAYDVNTITRSMLYVDEIDYSIAVVPWNQLSRIPSPRFSIAALVTNDASSIPSINSIVDGSYPLTQLSYVVVEGSCDEIKEIVRFLNYTLYDLGVRDILAAEGLSLSDATRDESIAMLHALECDGIVMKGLEQELARDLLYDGIQHWTWETSRTFWQNLKEFFDAAPIGSSIYVLMYAILLIGTILVFLYSFRLYEREHRAEDLIEKKGPNESFQVSFHGQAVQAAEIERARISTQVIRVCLIHRIFWLLSRPSPLSFS